MTTALTNGRGPVLFFGWKHECDKWARELYDKGVFQQLTRPLNTVSVIGDGEKMRGIRHGVLIRCGGWTTLPRSVRDHVAEQAYVNSWTVMDAHDLVRK